VKVKLCNDCCVAAITATSLFVPAPVCGAKELKNVSEIHDSDSAGVPANVAINEEAKMLIVALNIVSDAEPVVITNDQSPKESGVSRAFNAIPVAAA